MNLDYDIQQIEEILENACDDSCFGEQIMEHWAEMQTVGQKTYQRLHDFFNTRSKFYDDDGSHDPDAAHALALKKITRPENIVLIKMAFDLGLLIGVAIRGNSND